MFGPRIHGLLPILALSCSAPPELARPPSSADPRGALPTPPATAAPATSAPQQQLGPCEPGAHVDLIRVQDPVPGSFSAPGRDEVAGELACDAFHSGPALLRRAGDRLELTRFELRADPRTSRTGCRALRVPVGRDLLVCLDVAQAYGQRDQAIVVIDYARDDEHDRTELVSVADTTDTSCGGGSNVVAAKIDGFDLVDLDGDGALDVQIRVRAAKVSVPARPGCTMGSLDSGDPPKVRPPRERVVAFLLRGEALVLTPASAAVLAELAALKR
jgi:hypothetical protein